MDTKFWIERWEKQQIGFHQKEINGYLKQYWDLARALHPDSQVFVPLSGKSRDMIWLREQGHEVLGIELSELAVKDFFAENGLDFELNEHPHFKPYSCENIELLHGDFFSLQKEDLSASHLVYDRAALVAFPPEMRKRYVEHLTAILPEDVSILLVTMEYPQHEMVGPPFSVPESEVIQLYQQHYNIETLASFDIHAENPRFRERGLSSLQEKIFHLTSKKE